VQEFELIPIPFFKALFIDATGEVVIASNDIEIFERMKKAKYFFFSFILV
jgi:hypothetical protein